MIAHSFPFSVTGTSSSELGDGLVMPKVPILPGLGKALVSGQGIAADPVAVPGSPPSSYSEYFDRWSRDGSLKASFGNAKTAIKPFLADVGKSFDDPIGNEITTEFADRLKTHLASSGLNPRAASSRRYLLKKVHGCLTKDRGTATSCTSGTSFASTLNHLLSERKLKSRAIAKDIGVHSTTVRSWQEGTTEPGPTMFDSIVKLEKVLIVPAGTLTGLLFQGASRGTLRTGVSTTGKKQQALNKAQYRLSYRNWPPQAQAEFLDFVDFKTVVATSPSCKRTPRSGYRTDRTNRSESASASFHRGFFEGFFGYLRLKFGEQGSRAELRPKEVGQSADDQFMASLHLARLCDPILLGEYIEFCKGRSHGNCYSGGARGLLTLAKSMVRPKTGYVWNRAERYGTLPCFERVLPLTKKDDFGREILLATMEARWECFCSQTFEALKQLSHKITWSGNYRKSRNSDANISQILKAKSPLGILFSMETKMWEQPIPATWGVRKAHEFCKRLMISFLIRYAFRAGTLAEILVTDIADDGQEMILTLPPERFKTSRYLRNEYIIKLDPGLYPLIRKYLAEYRPQLAKNCRTKYLFFHLPSNRRNPENRGKFGKLLGTVVQSISQAYLGDLCPSGFRTHAIRHIMATDIILHDPKNGFTEAAKVLWESEETVRKSYFHLKNKEFLRGYSDRVASMSKLPLA